MSVKNALCLFLSVLLFFSFLSCAFAEDVLTPPLSPSGVTVSGIEDTRVTVSWAPEATANQYTVWIDDQRWAGSSSPGAEISGLQPYTEYTVYVTAANDAGESGTSSIVLFKTLPPVPGAPERPIVTDVSDTKGTIMWQPLPDWQYVQQYRIYVDGQPVADVDQQVGIQAAELTNLDPGVHYVRVSGVNENREGELSTTVKLTVQAVSAPTGFAMANRSHDKLFLVWDPVPGVEEYKLYLGGELLSMVTENSFVLDGLTAETEYDISLVAVFPDGNESAQAAVKVKTTAKATPLSLAELMPAVYDYAPDVMPGMIVVFIIGSAFAIARAGKVAIGRRIMFGRL